MYCKLNWEIQDYKISIYYNNLFSDIESIDIPIYQGIYIPIYMQWWATILFSWNCDPDPLFILLCDPFPDPDTQFVTRSGSDYDIIYIFN